MNRRRRVDSLTLPGTIPAEFTSAHGQRSLEASRNRKGGTVNRLATLILVLVVVIGIGCRRSQPAPQSVPVPPAATDLGQPVPAAPAPAAADTVAELPEFPGATRVAFAAKSDAEHGWVKVTEVKLMSTGAYQAVFDFYQQAIVANGWTVTSVESKPGKADWKLAKGTSVAQVEIDQESAGVEIKLERKDR
jgi:hypothetical protein